MEQTSIQPETMPWMHSPTARPTTPITATAVPRLRCSFSCRVAVGASNKFTRDVTPANNAATKNTAMRIRPPGISRNRLGR